MSRKVPTGSLLVWLVVFVLAATNVGAQISQTGSISGTVVDEQGLPMPGVTVAVSSDVLPPGREFVTDTSGQFLFTRLQPGAYRVTAKIAGMADRTLDAVVGVDRDTSLQVTMSAAGVTEAVTVTAATPEIDVRSAEISVNFRREQFETLPLQRSYSGLFELAPGVAQNLSFGTRGENTSFAPAIGGSRQENTYFLDGVNITNPAFGYLQQDLAEIDVAEVNFKRGGISAEFGRTGGFVANAVTRSGSNRFSGTARVELLPADFYSESADPNLTSSFDRVAPAIGVGGPIVQNRVFFYGSGNWLRRDETERVNRLGAIPDSTFDINEYFGKITATPSPNHFIAASYRRRDLEETFANITADALPGTGYDSLTDDNLAVASWTWFLSPSMTADVRYTHNNSLGTLEPLTDFGFRPTPFNPARPDLMGRFTTIAGLVVGGATSTGQIVGGYDLRVNDADYYRDEIKATVSWFKTFGKTTHDFRFGGGFDRGGEELTREGNGWGLITPASAANQASRCGGRPCFQAAYVSPQSQNSIGEVWSLFAQDRLSIGQRLTVSLGALFNRDELIGNDTISLITWNFVDQFQPRLGVTFVPDLTIGDKVWASYGRYYNADNRSFARAAAPLRIFTSDAFIDRETGQIYADLPRASETRKAIQDDLEPTYTDEFVVGYARPFGDWNAEVWGMYRTTENFIEDFPNPALGFRDPNVSYIMGNLNGGALDPADAYRKYKTVALEINRPMKDRWSFNASYAWSELTGNWDPDYTNVAVFFASSALQDGPGLFIDDPFRDGRLFGDRPHVFKVFSSVQPWKELTLGGYLRSQSGTPYNQLGRDYVNQFRRYLDPVGTYRTEAWTNVDVLASYGFRFGGSRRLVVEGRVLNLFDEQTVITVDQRVDPVQFTTPVFGNPTSYAPQRRFLVTARLDF
jgi:hypothetical protein